jgi:predicted phosphodiesterase
MTRYAILSDIHGNLPVLEAVLEDMMRRNIDRVINLGDHATGPLWPRETVAFVMQQPWVHLSGNCDRAVVEHDPGASHRYVFEQITAVELEWLASLQKSLTVDDEILIFHGIPADDDLYLLETVERGWQTEIITVAYDHEAAAEQAKRNARPDWERALRTGFMRD